MAWRIPLLRAQPSAQTAQKTLFLCDATVLALSEYATIYNPKKFHYSVYKVLPLDLTYSWMNPVHTQTPYFFEVHFKLYPHLDLPVSLFPSSSTTNVLYVFVTSL
jgi:hypothetical protein